MNNPNELERLSKAAEKTEDDIRYYSGGSKYNEPLEQLKDQLVHLYRAGQLVPVQQPSGDEVEAVAKAICENLKAQFELYEPEALDLLDMTPTYWRDTAAAAITAYEALRAKDTRP